MSDSLLAIEVWRLFWPKVAGKCVVARLVEHSNEALETQLCLPDRVMAVQWYSQARFTVVFRFCEEFVGCGWLKNSIHF